MLLNAVMRFVELYSYILLKMNEQYCGKPLTYMKDAWIARG